MRPAAARTSSPSAAFSNSQSLPSNSCASRTSGSRTSQVTSRPGGSAIAGIDIYVPRTLWAGLLLFAGRVVSGRDVQAPSSDLDQLADHLGDRIRTQQVGMRNVEGNAMADHAAGIAGRGRPVLVIEGHDGGGAFPRLAGLDLHRGGYQRHIGLERREALAAVRTADADAVVGGRADFPVEPGGRRGGVRDIAGRRLGELGGQ